MTYKPTSEERRLFLRTGLAAAVGFPLAAISLARCQPRRRPEQYWPDPIVADRDPEAHRCEVLLDGKPLEMCYSASISGGWAVVWVREQVPGRPSGVVLSNRERRFGRVELREVKPS